MRLKRLHAEADPVDSVREQKLELGRLCRSGIGFNREFLEIRARDVRVEDFKEAAKLVGIQSAGRAAAQKDRARRKFVFAAKLPHAEATFFFEHIKIAAR